MPRISVIIGLMVLGVLVARLGRTGSASPLYPLERPSEPPVIGDLFDSSRTGSVQGHVKWQGPVPKVASFRAAPEPMPGQPDLGLRPNPNAPRIDPGSSGVQGAVIFLRGVNPRYSRPWDHKAVRIEIDDQRIVVRHGNEAGNIGFVHGGETFTMVSMKQQYHALRARGAEFFTLSFPDPDSPLTRTAMVPGITELSSAAHHFWERAYLFTCHHAYYARTDAQGRFTLSQVPVGDYELVCWLPNWKEIGRERDPELCRVARVFVGPPVEESLPVHVSLGATAEAHYAIHSGMFRDHE